MLAQWDDLRHFLALAEHGGLNKAAEALGVSHVTVMRRVRALEQALRTDLFVRRPDGHRLTATGRDLVEFAREGGAIIDEALRRIVADAGEERAVRIMTTEIVANWVLLPHLAALSSRPSLAIDASPFERDLLDDSITLAVRFRRPGSGPYRIRRLGVIRVALFASSHLPETAAAGYIGWTGEFENIGLSRWLRERYDGAAPRIALTTIEAHRSAAAAGLGVAALPVFVADQDERLRRIDVDAPAYELTAWLTIPEAASRRRDVRAAVKVIRDAFAAARLT